MKALTIWQPWASLIAIGAKPYEFRSWPAPRALRGLRIVIHAGARPVRKAEVKGLLAQLASEHHWRTGLAREIALPMLERVVRDELVLALGHGLGTAILGEPTKAPHLPGMPALGYGFNDSDRDEHANYGWPLIDWRAFEPAVPCRGAQGFWDWPRDLPQLNTP
jgi:hypothetical protein